MAAVGMYASGSDDEYAEQKGSQTSPGSQAFPRLLVGRYTSSKAFQETAAPIPLSLYDAKVVGRGALAFSIPFEDSAVSREQCQLKWSRSKVALHLLSMGKNPTYITRSGRTDEEVVNPNQHTHLFHGDRFVFICACNKKPASDRHVFELRTDPEPAVPQQQQRLMQPAQTASTSGSSMPPLVIPQRPPPPPQVPAPAPAPASGRELATEENNSEPGEDVNANNATVLGKRVRNSLSGSQEMDMLLEEQPLDSSLLFNPKGASAVVVEEQKQRQDSIQQQIVGAGGMSSASGASSSGIVSSSSSSSSSGEVSGDVLMEEARAVADQQSGRFSIAIPPLATDERFGFDVEKGTKTAMLAIDDFLQRHVDPQLRVVVVDEDGEAGPILRMMHALHQRHPKRVVLLTGDITRLRDAGHPCSVIVNPATFRFKPDSGPKINQNINKAAGPQLCKLSQAGPKTGSVGVAYPITLPESSPLRQKQGVSTVLQAVLPNMNPTFHDYLNDDYEKGCTLLRGCYDSALLEFFRLTGLPPPSTSVALPRTTGASSIAAAWLSGVEFDGESKQVGLGAGAGAGAGVGSTGLHVPFMARSESQQRHYSVLAAPPYNPPPFKRPTGNPLGALQELLRNSQQHLEQVYWEDDHTLIVYDKYPKAKVHLLILPKESAFRGVHIDGPAYLLDKPDSQDLLMIEEMHKRGKWIAEGLHRQYPQENYIFRLGFHAVPSLKPLHLHVVSTDFVSDHMKSKKHWNSFTTDFFLNISDLVFMVKRGQNKMFALDLKDTYLNMLKQELRCHRCGSRVKTIPGLKSHISTCTTPIPTCQNPTWLACENHDKCG